MLLHQLQSQHPREEPQPRIGRGGKRGHTSGRGQKGQKSRSGHRIRPAERDLIMRLPKRRGYRYQSIYSKSQILNIKDLARCVVDVINPDALYAAHLIDDAKQPVKILSLGVIHRPVTLEHVIVSKQAKAKIEQAGGKINP